MITGIDSPLRLNAQEFFFKWPNNHHRIRKKPTSSDLGLVESVLIKMSELIENHIDLLLKGLVVADSNSRIVDFSVSDQNAALDAQGIAPKVPSDYQPILDETVTFIVAVILLNESTQEVLMTQEAQSSCYGI